MVVRGAPSSRMLPVVSAVNSSNGCPFEFDAPPTSTPAVRLAFVASPCAPGGYGEG